MTRIGLIFLILSLSAPAFAAKRTLVDCQGDLFSKPRSPLSRPTQQTQKISDLTIMQKRLWELRATGRRDEYNHLKRQMDIQLMLSKKGSAIGYAGEKRHSLYQITEVSMAVHRVKPWGNSELVAFELNEALGGPLNIPLTVSQVDGAFQLWFGYGPPPAYTQEEADRIWQRIDADGDLQLFLYLTSTHDLNLDRVKLDRDAGLVISGFENSFHLEEDASKEQLMQMIARSKFDWRSAFTRLDRDRILEMAAFRLSKPRARALEYRLCALRAVLNNTPISICYRSES